MMAGKRQVRPQARRRTVDILVGQTERSVGVFGHILYESSGEIAANGHAGGRAASGPSSFAARPWRIAKPRFLRHERDAQLAVSSPESLARLPRRGRSAAAPIHGRGRGAGPGHSRASAFGASALFTAGKRWRTKFHPGLRSVPGLAAAVRERAQAGAESPPGGAAGPCRATHFAADSARRRQAHITFGGFPSLLSIPRLRRSRRSRFLAPRPARSRPPSA
jgi:hypothetical protein